MRISFQLSIWFLLLGFSSSLLAQTEIRKCSIKSMIGSVKIRRGAAVNWVDARPNMPLREKDAIRTFIESEVELETTEGTSLKVGENSTIEMAVFLTNGETQNTKVRILNGSLMSNVKKLVTTKSSFEFETPTATAAIRGTIVGFNVSKEKTVIKVYEGTVLVSSGGTKSTVVLKENQMASITNGQKNIPIEKLEENSQRQPVKINDSVKVDSVKIDSLKTVNIADSAAAKKSSLDTTKLPIKNIPIKSSKDSIYQPDNGIVKGVPDNANLQRKAPVENSIIDPISSKASVLDFIVSSPIDGLELTKPNFQIKGKVSRGADVIVNSTRQQVAQDGSFSGQVTTPNRPGDYVIEFEAILNGKSQKISRTVRYKPLLQLTVLSPSDRQEFNKSIIPISGKVTPGAEVVVNSIKLLVTSDGSFNGQLVIPNEEGEILIEIESSLDGKTQRAVKTVFYKPEYHFVVTSPAEKQIVNSTQIQIKGTVQPSSSDITVNGTKVTVSPSGVFIGVISIPDEEGDVQLEFDVNSSGVSHSEHRSIIYKKKPDNIAPDLQGLFPDKPVTATISFTVIDRTVDEEITFFYDIDGLKNSETGLPNSLFTITLEDGIHNYSVYAKDKAGNLSSKMSKTITYLSTNGWIITMRKPMGNQYIDVPPSAPDDSYRPRYTIEFIVDNLPDDNMALIREVNIVNQTTGETAQELKFTSNYIEKDFELAPRKTNSFLIDVTDINGIKKTQRAQITLR